MIFMFAIPNCDTVKKARLFLEKNKIAYQFIDFKKSPPTQSQIQAWEQYLGELPINKKSLTYRKYKDEYEALNASEKINFIIANSSIIKRPILVQDNKILTIGFNEEQYVQMMVKID